MTSTIRTILIIIFAVAMLTIALYFLLFRKKLIANENQKIIEKNSFIKIKSKKSLIITCICLGACLVATIISGLTYIKFQNYDVYFNTDNVSEIQYLKDYSPNLEGTVGGETAIYVLKGPNVTDENITSCPSILILGGTHPNEPSGQLTAVTFLENLKVNGNTVVYILTETNKSAYTHSDPQEGTTMYYDLTTKNGKTRTFKFGSRATNYIDQWPNPDIHEHYDPSGETEQELSSNDIRNINRAYPGKINGTYTEKLAYGITQLIKQNDIKVTVDLHEASPEYITINAMVYHERATSLASDAILAMEMCGVTISGDKSPTNLRGLTHRELGDFTDTFAFLCETANAAQGKIRGAFTNDIITYYDANDKFYEASKELTIKYKNGDEDGKQILYGYATSINERVARHTISILSIIEAYNLAIVNGFDENTTAERATFLQNCGTIDVNLDLYSYLSEDDQLDYTEYYTSVNLKNTNTTDYENYSLENYNMLMELGVGYFLRDPE